ncbi:MAG: response regulator [Myxococcota bacterium]
MKNLLVVAGDRALTKFIAETLLQKKIERGGPSLKGNGWVIARSHSALEGQLMLTKSEQRFDAMVVDQNLPDRDVLSFLDQVRKLPGCDVLPIFVMSERGRDQLTRKLASEAYVVTGFIDKPVTSESLRRGLRNLERMRLVLLAEESKSVATEFERELRKAGFAVEVVESAKEAVALVATNRPDAVVISLGLGDMPGAELCVHMKRSAATHTIPVLLHGTVEELDAVDIQENAHRADDFLRDPVDGAALVDRISAIVGRGVSRIGPPPSGSTMKVSSPPLVGNATLADEESPLKLKTRDLPEQKGPPTEPPKEEWKEKGSNTKKNLNAVTKDELRSASLPEEGREGKEARLPKTITEDVHVPSGPKGEASMSATPPPASASPSFGAGPAKRSTRRVPCNLSVSFRDGETIYKSTTLNISNGGILIATDHPLEIGTHIDLNLELPTEGKPISAVGKVAWIGRAPGAAQEGSSSVGVGIKFSKIAPGDLKAIVDYVNSVSRAVYVAP